ncbi:MAG: type II toxin-antitoxin system RelE/ParE family toxin [Candidatus Omnitrophota bacterium]
MKYSVKYPNSNCQKRVEKELLQMPAEIRERTLLELENLSVCPRPFGIQKIKPPLAVGSVVAQYRIRIGSWRLLYDIDEGHKTIWIITLRRRNEDTYK